MNENEVREIRYLVGEAWMGAYDPAVTYGNANVVQDEIGLSVYRSLKSGNVGHPLSDRSWWFLIIDLSSIKTESDRIQALNNAIAADELARVSAENARNEAETQRQANENGRNSAETQRAQKETEREASETTRQAHEGTRENNETTRENAEAQRAAAEGTRAQSEQARQSAEAERQVNENNRSGAETARQQAETSREQTATSDHNRAESDHNTAASDHTTAGNDHTQAATDHTTAANDHTQAATDHTTAANDHTQAATDHTTANNDHTRAEGDHTQAVSDHSTAGSDHTRAENDHTQAVSDHETYAGHVTRAEAAALSASDSAVSASQSAEGAAGSAAQTASDVAELKQAIQNLPDGQAVSAQVAINTTEIAKLNDIVADLETIAEGYVRVAGSSSPSLSYKSYKYHEAGGFGRESVFSLFYPCLVGTMVTGAATVGKVLHVLQKLDFEHDIYGNPRKIDGSEGDVQISNFEPYWAITGKHSIEGTEYDVFLVSRTPFTWQGIEAVEVNKFGSSPDRVVSHTDSDNVTRMHSVYNPEWNGSYNAPTGVTGKYIQSTDPETGDIVETFDETATLLGGAGGLHTTDLALYTAEQRAMNNNADVTKTVPWFNHTAEVCNRLQALLLAEGGTFDAHNANKMGSGFSSNDAATAAADWEQSGSSAKNGLRVLDKNGAWKYYAMGSNVRFLFGEASGTRYAANCINAWRDPWHIMEAHRAMSYAIKNDVHELEWFTFEGNKYKYRSVDGFAGPSHGEMTCVVWKLMATQAGANAVDPTDGTTSIAGNRVEILVSTCLFHGVVTSVSPAWWTSGLIFTEDENGKYTAYIERDQASLLISPTGDKNVGENWPFETQYLKLGEFVKGEGYARNYHNEALMMPDTNANKSGGSLHTYVGKYNWFTGGNAPAGKKSVRGWLRGAYAYISNLSPLSVGASYSPSGEFSGIVFGTCVEIVSD